MYTELLKELGNTQAFLDSLKYIITNFSINSLIMMLMMVFSIISAVDKLRGNKLGYGEKFDEAFGALKPLAPTMIGIITLSPVLKLLLEPIIVPVYTLFGASPAMFAGTLFPIDSGAYPLAHQLAGGDAAIANFSSIVLGPTFGCLFIGTIPICMFVLDKKYYDYLSMAVLVAVITIPLGAVAGGLLMAATPYALPLSKILINLIPIIIVAALVALGLALRPRQVMRGFCAFGRVMQVVLIFSTVISAVQAITGLRIPLLRMMVEPAAEGGVSPLTESLIVVGNIALVLTGAFPMVLWVSRVFKRPIQLLSAKLGMNEAGGAALIASLASLFPALDLIPEMNPKGRLLVITFCVSAAFILGDHLAFTAGIEQNMILPMIASKFIAGVSAMILANMLAPRLLKDRS